MRWDRESNDQGSGKSTGVAIDNHGIQARSHYAPDPGNGADQCHDTIPVRAPDFKPAGWSLILTGNRFIFRPGCV